MDFDDKTTVDVVAAVVGSELVAREALAAYGSLDALHRASQRDLMRLEGMGPARATRIKAALEIGRRAASERLRVGRVVESPDDVYEAFRALLRSEEREVFMVLGLDVRNRIRLVHRAAVGSVSRLALTARDVFTPLVREGAVRAIVVHNHPSGDPSPSTEDEDLTRRLVEAGKLLGIELLDHVVVAAEGYVSLRDRGVL